MNNAAGRAFELATEVMRTPLRYCETTAIRGKRYNYRLRPAQTTEVYDKKGIRIGEACLVFRDNAYPAYDKMIAEYILIKSDENLYLRIARTNFSTGIRIARFAICVIASAIAMTAGILLVELLYKLTKGG